MMNATQESVDVFWNIGRCPVPPGFDASRVGPCIKRYLEKLGYSIPHTISAIGLLTDVPVEVLRAVSSTGILLHVDPFGSSVRPHMFGWVCKNLPPANIMIIPDPRDRSCCRDLHMLEHEIEGYNVIKPYPFGPATTIADAECLWKSFLLNESGAPEEDKCIETGESPWVCSVCDLLNGQGFENLITHISSEEHARVKSSFFTPVAKSDEEYDEEYDEAVEIRFEPQPPSWERFPLQPCSQTISECPLANATTTVIHQRRH